MIFDWFSLFLSFVAFILFFFVLSHGWQPKYFVLKLIGI